MPAPGASPAGKTVPVLIHQNCDNALTIVPPKLKLSLFSSICLLFIFISVPALIFILLYSYAENSKNLNQMLDAALTRARDDSVTIATSLLDPVISTLRIVAELAASDPSYFRTEESRNLLYRALTSVDYIDAFYTSFEDGYHRVVTRIDADRRRSDFRIPANANWHSSYIDAYTNAILPGATRWRHRSFFETWPKVILEYDSPFTADVRTLTHYVGAKRNRALDVAEPTINPDTGYPVLSIGYPILKGDEFLGFAAANITVGTLSKYLDAHKVSPNGKMLVIDQAGHIIAHPDPSKGVRSVNGKRVVATVADLGDPVIDNALQERDVSRAGRLEFTVGPEGIDYIAAVSVVPVSFGNEWMAVIVAPVDDFIGGLKKISRNLAVLISALIVVELLLVFVFVRRITRPLTAVTEEIRQVQALNFDQHIGRRSVIREIYNLQSAADLLARSLRSLSAFVPVGVVRQLVDSGRSLTLGAESRFLTIFFSDLENFSTVAESVAPDELMKQVSLYFEAVAGAITDEKGTIDKFIGDSVMAFWGAPNPVEDQVYRACAGALRAAARVERLNEQWAREERPQMRVRIGLHCADVVVGNIGSSDRLNYTVMGDGVNVASRLEGLNKEFKTTICVSDSVHNAVADRVIDRPIKTVSVKGRQGTFMAYELIAIRNACDPELTQPERAN